VPLEQTPTSGRGTLLKLACRGVAAEATFQRFNLLQAEAHRPEQLAEFLAWIDEADRGGGARTFILGRKTQEIRWCRSRSEML